MKFLDQWTYIYAAVGGAALLAVALFAQISGGAKLGFEIAGINIQPSEFVKIIFDFFVAASLYRIRDFRNVVITTAIAALHVLILVASKDLGAALIVFVVYLVMLYVATRQPVYICGRLRGRESCFGSRVFSVFSCENESNGLERSVCCLQQWGISGGAVAVCDRYRRLVRTWTLPGTSG